MIAERVHKSIAGLLLLLLCLATVPRITWHQWMADHEDRVSCAHPVKAKHCVHQHKPICSSTDPFITHSYLQHTPFAGELIISWTDAPVRALPQDNLQSFTIDRISRGPPAFA